MNRLVYHHVPYCSSRKWEIHHVWTNPHTLTRIQEPTSTIHRLNPACLHVYTPAARVFGGWSHLGLGGHEISLTECLRSPYNRFPDCCYIFLPAFFRGQPPIPRFRNMSNPKFDSQIPNSSRRSLRKTSSNIFKLGQTPWKSGLSPGTSPGQSLKTRGFPRFFPTKNRPSKAAKTPAADPPAAARISRPRARNPASPGICGTSTMEATSGCSWDLRCRYMWKSVEICAMVVRCDKSGFERNKKRNVFEKIIVLNGKHGGLSGEGLRFNHQEQVSKTVLVDWWIGCLPQLKKMVVKPTNMGNTVV